VIVIYVFFRKTAESSPHVPPPTSLTFSQRIGLSLSASLSTVDRLGIKLLFSPDGAKLACLNLHGQLTIFSASNLSIVYRSPVLDVYYPPIQLNIPAAPYNLIDLPAVHGEPAELNPNGTWLAPAGDGISDFGWWSNDGMFIFLVLLFYRFFFHVFDLFVSDDSNSPRCSIAIDYPFTYFFHFVCFANYHLCFFIVFWSHLVYIGNTSQRSLSGH
jgi:WD40 repeat protein